MARNFRFYWEWGVEDYLHYAMFTIKKFVKNIVHLLSVGGGIDFVPLSWAEVEVDGLG